VNTQGKIKFISKEVSIFRIRRNYVSFRILKQGMLNSCWKLYPFELKLLFGEISQINGENPAL